jgi:hypothetical protein
MYISKLLAFIFLLVFSLAAFSQKEDMSQYFDEGVFNKKNTTLKINPISLVFGEIPIFLEYEINGTLGIEVGAGLLFSKYNRNLALALSEPTFFNHFVEDTVSGSSIYIMPKFYFFKNGPKGGAIALRYRQKNYSLKNIDSQAMYVSKSNDIALLGTLRKPLSTNFNFEVQYGAGYQFYKYHQTGTPDNTVYLSLGFLLGYIIF